MLQSEFDTSFRTESKIGALEAKLAAMEAEKQALSRDGSEEIQTSTSQIQAPIPTNLPKKPSEKVIEMGDKLEQEAQAQAQEQLPLSVKSRKLPKEAPKATLGTLNASFGKP